MDTFDTKYGKISLLSNEIYIGGSFKDGKYWDEDILLKLRDYVNPDRNILEIGGHCGTSSIVYSSFLNTGKNIFVYEPQSIMYSILVKNINQNNLQDKIKAFNTGVFCYNGIGIMNNIDVDGGWGYVDKRYNEESNLPCNFGGICLGETGEPVNLTTIDSMNLEDIGFIHCDAQGSENFIFSKGVKTIADNRPVIYYENKDTHGDYLYNIVRRNYPQYEQESLFDIKTYCMDTLNYSEYIVSFEGQADSLLIP
jgi:FkbM family methyltransferase